jgi:hypothetical protein
MKLIHRSASCQKLKIHVSLWNVDFLFCVSIRNVTALVGARTVYWYLRVVKRHVDYLRKPHAKRNNTADYVITSWYWQGDGQSNRTAYLDVDAQWCDLGSDVGDPEAVWWIIERFFNGCLQKANSEDDAWCDKGIILSKRLL